MGLKMSYVYEIDEPLDFMWNDISIIPHGCVGIKVIYDGRDDIVEMCSCDVHWSLEKPVLWRYA